jgi:parallel beta-helix repeat protein
MVVEDKALSRRADGLVFSLCAVVLLSAAFAATSNVPKVLAQGTTIYILPDGSISPSTTTLTTADNITYTFTGNINEQIAVQRNNVIVNGNGYTLQGSGVESAEDGFNLTGVSNVTIKNTSITGFIAGIYLASLSDSNVIIDNNVTANYSYGIWLDNSSDNVLSDNVVTSNVGFGILVNSSSDQNSLSANSFTANNYGVWLGLSNDNSLSSNNVTANNFGIWVSSCDNNSFFGNNVANNNNCIILNNSPGNILSGNIFTVSFSDGVYLDNSSSNILSGNSMISNTYGVYLLSSSNDTLSDNNITNNGYGVYIQTSSGNVLSGNTFTTNRQDAVELNESSANSIFHNNFINNTLLQAYVEGPLNESVNAWDDGYPSGGNYWSDYSGADSFSGPYQNETGSDGIGDTPNVIDPVIIDHYPLMGTFSEFKIASNESVQLISNTSVSQFTFNGSAISFNVENPNTTAGFCRICIPTALINAPYKVYANGTEIPYTLLPSSNLTKSYLYINLAPATEEVTITPEFPSPFILLLFMLVTAAAAINYRRKRLN